MIIPYISKLIIILILAINSYKDIREHEISIPITLAGIPVGIVCAVLTRNDLPVGIILSVLPGIVSFALTLASGGQIGAGDGLMLCVLGFFYPPGDMLLIVSAALIMSAVYGGALLMRRHGGGEAYAFVPFLMAGVCVLEFIS
ncbi:MAG: prepilin peptidase [Lachnospiraceae bacterium]|nr:prepilin peptidase [Lachnospiraceae bacterium]